MWFTYKPDGAEQRKWEWDPDTMLSSEAEEIETVARMPYAEWAEQVDKGSVRALHALLYVFLKRDAPTLRHSQVQFKVNEVGFEVSDEEGIRILAGLRAKVEAGEGTDADTVTIALLEAQLPEGAEQFPPPDEGAPAEGPGDAPGEEADPTVPEPEPEAEQPPEEPAQALHRVS